MLQKIALYGIGIYVLGLLFTGLTYAIYNFAPYFVAGMVLTTPIYGAVRKSVGKHAEKGKNEKIHKSIDYVKKGLMHLVKINKKSISVYLVLLIVVSHTYEIMGETIVKSLIVGIMTVAVSFVLWEITRFIANKTKKIQLLSYGEAVRGAF